MHCAYSASNRRYGKYNEDECEKYPYWRERVIRAAYVRKKVTPPTTQLFDLMANHIGFTYTKVKTPGFTKYINVVSINGMGQSEGGQQRWAQGAWWGYTPL